MPNTLLRRHEEKGALTDNILSASFITTFFLAPVAFELRLIDISQCWEKRREMEDNAKIMCFYSWGSDAIFYTATVYN